MANDLTAIMPKILARGLMTLRETCIMPRLVNSDYSREAARKGQTIDVPIPTAVSTRDVSPSHVPPSSVNNTPDLVQVPLDQWKQNDPIHLTDKELVEVDRNTHFMPMQMEEAIKGLANNVNQFIMAKYRNTDRGVFGVFGTAGTTPFGSGVGVKSATRARAVLNKQLCPKEDRRGVLDFDAEAAALELAAFSDAEKIGSSDVKLRGEIGLKFGTLWAADDHVPTHTAGTIATNGGDREAAVDNGGGYPAGTSAIDVDEGAADSVTGTIVVGDIIQFAGHDQTYVVIANPASAQYSAVNQEYTFATNAISGLSFFPALKQPVADDEVIEVLDDHVVNLVFHRDAFAFATRPLVTETSDLALGSRIMSLQDAKTGLVLRLEVSRQHKQVAWEFDILYGAKLVRPELAMRLLG